ncbi:MAG TPA: HlyC/CorC family transporter, partial [Gammaproteobacteria bacterium]
FVALLVLIILSAFFSGSETGLMSLNRYRMRHLAREGHAGALRARRLLQRPDRLIGLILLGNNFVNIAASAIATVIALRLLGEVGIAVATGLLTLVILIFAEVTPKTLAALHPERIAFVAAWVYEPLLKVLYPLVWVVNWIGNNLLRLLGVDPDRHGEAPLTSEELRSVVLEAPGPLPKRHRRMLLSILDLEEVTVEDIMVPRNEVIGIDLDDDWDEILQQLATSPYARLPVFRESLDNVVGYVHLRKMPQLLLQDSRLSREEFERTVRKAYFIPAGTPLNKQLINFQRQKRRFGLVVNEYGDILGLVTMEDLLEEIVGEFTTDPADTIKDVFPQEDGSYLVDGSANIRELNRSMGWQFPTEGPKTLNGLIIDYLEDIPEPGTTVRLAGYPVEVVQTTGNAVKMARVYPELRRE